MLVTTTGAAAQSVTKSTADVAFEKLAARYVDEYAALSPVGATQLGDHRFDARLDDVSPAARRREAAFYRRFLARLGKIDRGKLSRENQVDYELLRNALESGQWSLSELQEWAWNPVVYTGLAGQSIYGLVARDFAPWPERLRHVTARLQEIPTLLAQARRNLEPARVPRVHAETAVKQNPGLISILDGMVTPHLGELSGADRAQLEQAMAKARAASQEQQAWLEGQLLPNAKGDFRIGAAKFDRKLAFALHTPLTRQEIKERAQQELARVREQMYDVAKTIYLQQYPETSFPGQPEESYKQAVTRAALEVAYRDLPDRERIVETAKAYLIEATEFVRRKGFVEVPSEPVDVIVMPEYARGVSIAFCDSPGPLDQNQKTFYAVAPLPEEWTPEQVRSFLREYNAYSLRNLTIHEAMPGHYLQIAIANRFPSTVRSVLSSGPFVEGWAVYAERVMADEGFLGGDPRMKLIQLKWYLRVVTNALIDQAIHVDGMSRDEAMKLMVEDGYQEEREAALKWVRAQLSSTQLSTYFVGYQEHHDMRRAAEEKAGQGFDLRRYHDSVLAHGSPPVQFVRALVLDQPIPAVR